MGITTRVHGLRALFLCFTGGLGLAMSACVVPPHDLPLPVSTTRTTTLATSTTAAPTTTTTAPPLSVGSGGSDPAAFVDAYNRKGGEASLGKPMNSVHSWGWGCSQDLSGGGYNRSTLMQPHCSGTVYPVVGAQWAYISSHYGDNAPSIIGYPYNDPHRWGKGWVQDFDGGGLGWTILARGDDVGAVHVVENGFLRSWIYDFNGAPGPLGYPVSDGYIWGAGSRIDFQTNSLIWDGPGGVRLLGGKPTPTSGSRESKAADWALSELNSPNPSWSDDFQRPWSGWCEGFVEDAYGFSGGGQFGSADEHYNWQAANGRIHTDANPPRGTVVFYSGHVGISLGDGTTISTQGYEGQRLNVWHHATTGFLYNTYLGWSYAPDGWSGR